MLERSEVNIRQPRHGEQAAARTNFPATASHAPAVNRTTGRARIVIPFRPRAAIPEHESLYRVVARRPPFLLRLSLAAVFFWFGALKLAGVSPVVEMLRGSFPLLADAPFLQLLGVAEVLIAAGLILNRLSRQTGLLMVLHLTATLRVARLSPPTVPPPAVPRAHDGGRVLSEKSGAPRGGRDHPCFGRARTCRRRFRRSGDASLTRPVSFAHPSRCVRGRRHAKKRAAACPSGRRAQAPKSARGDQKRNFSAN